MLGTPSQTSPFPSTSSRKEKENNTKHIYPDWTCRIFGEQTRLPFAFPLQTIISPLAWQRNMPTAAYSKGTWAVMFYFLFLSSKDSKLQAFNHSIKHFMSRGNEDCTTDLLGPSKALLIFVKILFNSLHKLKSLERRPGGNQRSVKAQSRNAKQSKKIHLSHTSAISVATSQAFMLLWFKWAGVCLLGVGFSAQYSRDLFFYPVKRKKSNLI